MWAQKQKQAVLYVDVLGKLFASLRYANISLVKTELTSESEAKEMQNEQFPGSHYVGPHCSRYIYPVLFTDTWLFQSLVVANTVW